MQLMLLQVPLDMVSEFGRSPCLLTLVRINPASIAVAIRAAILSPRSLETSL